jgi:hypothetical protein
MSKIGIKYMWPLIEYFCSKGIADSLSATVVGDIDLPDDTKIITIEKSLASDTPLAMVWLVLTSA